MLNTNQSNRKNIWKYVLVLPLLTGFMLLFQVETIAQEKISKTSKKEIKKDAIIQNENFESIYNSPYESDTKENLKRVFVINGKVYTKDDLKDKNIAQFKNNATISKLEPKEAIKLYGQNAKDGAVIFNGDWKIVENVFETEKIIVDGGDSKQVEEILKEKTVVSNSDKDAKIEIERAKKEIERAKIEIENAKPEIERAKKEIERAKIEIERAKIEIERAKKEIKKSSSISQSDVAPEPQNGMQEFRKYIATNFRLPEVEKDVDATIVAKFIVLKTGEISGITIITESPKNLGLNDEMIRVLKESPKWKPGTKEGKPADIYFTLPVSIRIEATKK